MLSEQPLAWQAGIRASPFYPQGQGQPTKRALLPALQGLTQPGITSVLWDTDWDSNFFPFISKIFLNFLCWDSSIEKIILTFKVFLKVIFTEFLFVQS